MKVIGRCNYDKDTTDDVLVEENLTPEAAKAKAKEMNDASGDEPTYWYEAVEDDYKLKVWEP